jgi:Cu(I)/Ag(I) efflux system membrane fusion protein
MSQIRRVSLAIAVVAAIGASYGLGRHNLHSQPNTKAGRHVLYYVDPMHPSYKSDKPGIAPDCGMQLEPVFADQLANVSASSPLEQWPSGTVRIDSAAQRLLGIRLASVQKSGATRNVRVVGRVVPEDTRVYRINSGADGFIQETHNDSVGTRVKKDQTLATYYSPEFLSVASGFLAATERVPGSVGTDGSRTMPFPGAVSKQGVSSLNGYSDRLRNLGMSEVQIQRIADSRKLPENIDVVAPTDGFILSRNVSAGQHFDHNMEFYRIADLRRVWVVAEVDENEASYLRPGDLAKITLNGAGRQLQARISDSLPQSEAGGGTVKFRLEVENSKFTLRPEMLVDVELPIRLPRAVTVPLDALVDSGAHARVYVERGEGVFEPREVETGWRFGERVEILRGVEPGERVVAAATFLVDSESRLKTPTVEAPPVSAPDSAVSLPEHVAVAKAVPVPGCSVAGDSRTAGSPGKSLALPAPCAKKVRDDPSGASARHPGDGVD